jgi:hypothetical protein
VASFLDDEADMRRYIGPNWPKYRDVWLAMKGEPSLVPSRSLAAAIFTSLWLLYRKRYMLALAVMALQVVAAFGLLDLGGLIDLAIAVILGRYGKSIVVRDGVAAIATIRSVTGAEDDVYLQIVRAGGTNIIAPIVGASLVSALVASVFVAGWHLLTASSNAPGDAALFDALRVLHDSIMEGR